MVVFTLTSVNSVELYFKLYVCVDETAVCAFLFSVMFVFHVNFSQFVCLLPYCVVCFHFYWM